MQWKTVWLMAKHFRMSVFKNEAVFIIATFISALIAFAAYTGWQNFKKQNEFRAYYQEQARKDWLGNPDKHPHRMAHYGHYAFRPKDPLSFFDFGMESFFGNAIYLEAHVQNTVNFSEAGLSTGILRFGEISVAMILQTLAPLLIFFLGFSSIAAERENGTLKILMTQGVSWRQLLVGKSLGLISVVTTLFLPAIILVMIFWALLQNMQVNLDQVLRLLSLIASYIMYLSIISVIAVLVSAVSKTSKTALTTLVGIWLMCAIVLPRASQSLGKSLYEIPSKTKFNAAVEEDIMKEGDSHNPDDPHYKKLKDSVLAANKVDSIQQLPFNYSGFVMKEGERISATIHNEHAKKLKDIYERQNGFSKLLAFVNPYMGIKNLSMSLSNTGYASYAGFQQQAEQYRYHLAQSMNELQVKYISNKSLVSTEKPYSIDKKHWASIDEFTYQPTRIASVFKNEYLSILSLVFWIVVLGLVIRRLSKTLQVI